jgi:hypothetical protein
VVTNLNFDLSLQAVVQIVKEMHRQVLKEDDVDYQAGNMLSVTRLSQVPHTVETFLHIPVVTVNIAQLHCIDLSMLSISISSLFFSFFFFFFW